MQRRRLSCTVYSNKDTHLDIIDIDHEENPTQMILASPDCFDSCEELLCFLQFPMIYLYLSNTQLLTYATNTSVLDH